MIARYPVVISVESRNVGFGDVEYTVRCEGNGHYACERIVEEPRPGQPPIAQRIEWARAQAVTAWFRADALRDEDS